MNSPMMVPETTKIAAVESPGKGGRGGQSPSGQLCFIGAETHFFIRRGKTENGAVHVSEFMNWLVMT